MHKPLIAALAALPLVVFAPHVAHAGSVDIGVGIGVDPDYDDDDDYRPRRMDRRRGVGRLSCGEARRLVRRNGYRNVETRDCSGRTYSFRATRRGDRVRVFVNSRNGAVWGG